MTVDLKNDFKAFVAMYSTMESTVYPEQLYKVRVIDAELWSTNKTFLDKTGNIYVYATSRTKAQIEARRLARSHNVKIETGFAREC